MSERRLQQAKAFGEAIEAYGPESAHVPHTKLSISLPADLVELVRAIASDSGLSVSAVIGASLRRTIAEAEQARLDAAIEAQNQENLEWAKAYLPITAKLWSELEW